MQSLISLNVVVQKVSIDVQYIMQALILAYVFFSLMPYNSKQMMVHEPLLQETCHMQNTSL